VLYGVAIIGVDNIISSIDISGLPLVEQFWIPTIPFLLLIVAPVLYRYILYQYCGCCEKSASASATSTGTATVTATATTTTLTEPLLNENAEAGENHHSLPHPPSRRMRYPFLDNVKVFLTAIVVCHHISIAFKYNSVSFETIIIVPNQQKIPFFSWMLQAFTTLNQGYFMPLFFFISAFFVPSSYAKGREKFLRGKWKRILLPALFVTFTIYPISQLSSIYYVYGSWIWMWWPSQDQAWFLYWLLILNWVYMSIIESTDTTTNSTTGAAEDVLQEEEARKMPFPSTWTRLFYGVTLCGIVLDFFRSINRGSFATMPTAIGSWTADFLMFYAGILAKKHGWLEKDLAEQLDIPLSIFFPWVVIEGIFVVFLPNPIANGFYCVDMSLAVLIIFQRWFNYETKLSKILARSAYCVYLIHTIILLVTTIIYLELYRVVFGSGEGTEVGRIVGGFIFVLVSTHGILWPLSYALTRLPILRDII